jgi:hypothetical protein
VIRGLLLTALVAIPFGLLAAALLRRPLEAAMLLLIVSGMQLILDPFGTAARFFPFWSVRELGTWTVDGTDGGYVRRALLHAGLAALLLSALTVLARPRAAPASAPAGCRGVTKGTRRSGETRLVRPSA